MNICKQKSIKRNCLFLNFNYYNSKFLFFSLKNQIIFFSREFLYKKYKIFLVLSFLRFKFNVRFYLKYIIKTLYFYFHLYKNLNSNVNKFQSLVLFSNFIYFFISFWHFSPFFLMFICKIIYTSYELLNLKRFYYLKYSDSIFSRKANLLDSSAHKIKLLQTLNQIYYNSNFNFTNNVFEINTIINGLKKLFFGNLLKDLSVFNNYDSLFKNKIVTYLSNNLTFLIFYNNSIDKLFFLKPKLYIHYCCQENLNLKKLSDFVENFDFKAKSLIIMPTNKSVIFESQVFFLKNFFSSSLFNYNSYLMLSNLKYYINNYFLLNNKFFFKSCLSYTDIFFQKLKKLNAIIINDYVCTLLKTKLTIRRIINPLFFYLKKKGKKYYSGLVISIKGRFTKNRRSTFSIFKWGNVSYSSLSENIDYSESNIVLRYGLCTVRVWVSFKKKY